MKTRPSNVVHFEQLMCASLILYLLEIILFPNWKYLSETPDGLRLVQTARFSIIWSSCLFLCLIWNAARKRTNWARWLLLIWFACDVTWQVYVEPRHFLKLNSIPIPAMSLAMSLLVASLFVLHSSFEGIALFLIFTGNAREWFKRSSQVRKTGPLHPA
jgi:hypothetical protein